MQIEPQQLQDLKNCYSVLEKVALGALQKGLFGDFNNATIAGTALQKFKQFIDGAGTGSESEKYSMDSGTGDSTNQKPGGHIQAKKRTRKKTEKPTEGSGADKGTEPGADPGAAGGTDKKQLDIYSGADPSQA